MKLINFCIVYLAAQIGNKIEWLKAKMKLRILVGKVDRNKISKDEFVKLGQVLVDEYGKWQIKSMEKMDKATRNLEKIIKGE